MLKHTPGPWFYDKRTGSIGCDAGWIVGTHWHDKKGDGEFGDRDADGCLIAAAPDLLVTLEILINSYTDHYAYGDYCEWCGTGDGKHSDKCPFTVIAKARGEQASD